MNIKKRLCILLNLLLMASLPQAANGAAITNLSDRPETIGVESASGFVPVTIQPWGTWRIPGDVKVQVHGREVRIEADEEFALWKDGTFGPQRRLRHMNKP